MSKITVRGPRALAFQQYGDEAQDIGDVVDAYTDTATKTPGGLDVATLAIALKKHVRFTAEANRVFLAVLDRNVERVAFDAVRAGIDVTPKGRAIVAACEHAGAKCVEQLAEACVLLFMEAHPKLVEVDAREAVTPDLEPYVRPDETDDEDDRSPEDPDVRSDAEEDNGDDDAA